MKQQKKTTRKCWHLQSLLLSIPHPLDTATQAWILNTLCPHVSHYKWLCLKFNFTSALVQPLDILWVSLTTVCKGHNHRHLQLDPELQDKTPHNSKRLGSNLIWFLVSLTFFKITLSLQFAESWLAPEEGGPGPLCHPHHTGPGKFLSSPFWLWPHWNL